jgi:hypothetical protein
MNIGGEVGEECFVVFGDSVATETKCSRETPLPCIDVKPNVFAEEGEFLQLDFEIVCKAYRKVEVVR